MDVNRGGSGGVLFDVHDKDTHEHTSLHSQSNQDNTVSGAYTWSSLPAGKPSYS